MNLREYDLDIVNRFNDRIYFGTRSGLILAMREIGLPEPKLLRDPKQLPFGYIPPEGIKDTPPTAPAAEPAATPEAGQEPAADANAAAGRRQGARPEEGRPEGAGVIEARARPA